MFLRGVPSEIIVFSHMRHQLTPAGASALAIYSKALKENGAFIVHGNEHRPIVELTMTTWTTLTKTHLGNNGLPTKLGTLQRDFGKERGQNLWDERKAREEVSKRQWPGIRI